MALTPDEANAVAAAREVLEEILPELLYSWRTRLRAAEAILVIANLDEIRSEAIELFTLMRKGLHHWEPEIQAWLERKQSGKREPVAVSNPGADAATAPASEAVGQSFYRVTWLHKRHSTKLIQSFTSHSAYGALKSGERWLGSYCQERREAVEEYTVYSVADVRDAPTPAP